MTLLLLQDFTSCIFQLGGLGLRSWSVCLWNPQCALEMLFFSPTLSVQSNHPNKATWTWVFAWTSKEKIRKPVSRHFKKNTLENVKANMERKEEQPVELPLQMYLMMLFKPCGTQGFQDNSWDFKGRKANKVNWNISKWIKMSFSSSSSKLNSFKILWIEVCKGWCTTTHYTV